MKKQFSEVRNQYTDDLNYTHIDVWITADDVEAGRTVAVIDRDNKKVFFLDNMCRGDEQVMEAIKEVLDSIDTENKPIMSMLDLSTGYVTARTAKLLDTKPKNIIMYPKGEYGWIVYVPETIDDDTPSDLSDVLLYAKNKGCQWVMFDRDGGDVDGLTKYEW